MRVNTAVAVSDVVTVAVSRGVCVKAVERVNDVECEMGDCVKSSDAVCVALTRLAEIGAVLEALLDPALCVAVRVASECVMRGDLVIKDVLDVTVNEPDRRRLNVPVLVSVRTRENDGVGAMVDVNDCVLVATMDRLGRDFSVAVCATVRVSVGESVFVVMFDVRTARATPRYNKEAHKINGIPLVAAHPIYPQPTMKLAAAL